jgi:chromosomal replication initiator protein
MEQQINNLLENRKRAISNLEEIDKELKRFGYSHILDAKKVIKVVSDHYKIKNLLSHKKMRTPTYVLVRDICMYIVKKNSDCTFKETGKIFNKDHSTVIFAVNKIDNKMKKDGLFNGLILELILKSK